MGNYVRGHARRPNLVAASTSIPSRNIFASTSPSLPAAEFRFTFSVAGKRLQFVQPRSVLELSEEFLTVVNGLAFLWNVKIGPELACQHSEASKGLGIIFSLANGDDFKRDGTGEARTWVHFFADIQSNGHKEKMGFSQSISDFLTNPGGCVMPRISVSKDGELTVKVRLRFITSVKIGLYLPDQPTPTLSLCQEITTLLAADKRVKECPNVRIQCSDGVIESSRALLSSSGPYYATAFRHNEINGLEVGKLNHETISKKVVKELLRCLYIGGVAHSVKQLSVKEKMELFRLADFVESRVSLLLTRHLTRV